MSSWPDAPRPSPDSVRRRQGILEAAARHDTAPARTGLGDTEPRVRATAIGVLSDAHELSIEAIAGAASDPSPLVRRTLARIGAQDARVSLCDLLVDDDSSVAEVACWAAGERGADGAPFVALLDTIARGHEDALCRESAVAALGAIGHPDGLAAILHAMTDRATVRRRAVLALAPFDGVDVDAALQAALDDRDWQVRQGAEDLRPPD